MAFVLCGAFTAAVLDILAADCCFLLRLNRRQLSASDRGLLWTTRQRSPLVSRRLLGGRSTAEACGKCAQTREVGKCSATCASAYWAWCRPSASERVSFGNREDVVAAPAPVRAGGGSSSASRLPGRGDTHCRARN